MKIIDKTNCEKFIHHKNNRCSSKSPDGLIVKTDDGQEHNLAFSADNGVPD
jgi:hypothetical protein